MKYRKNIVTVMLFLFCTVSAFSQNSTIRGTVTESNGTPLAGASVMENDAYNNATYPVHVAFRTVEHQHLLGGVSVIDEEKMISKAYATGSLQFLEATIGGIRGSNSWGNDGQLVVIDGIPRDDNNVLPSEIEQITVLKGVNAIALYGSRASKGVIMITTKRGKNEPLSISVRANTGLYFRRGEYPKYLGSAEYMTLYNKARENDGLAPSFSDEDIYNHGSGLNPYRYPDLNFYSSDYLKKTYGRSEAMAEITGGKDRTRYYTSAGYYRQSSILKVGNTENNNINRLFLRGNVDVMLHENINAHVDANVTFYDSKSANTNFWNGAATLRPHRVAPLIPLSYIEDNDYLSSDIINTSRHIIDGKYFLGGSSQDQTNPIADAYAAGEGQWISRQYQFNGGVDFHLKKLAENLFFRGNYGVDYHTTYNQTFNENYATFAPVWSNYNGADVIQSITKYGDDNKTGNQNVSNTTYRTTTYFSGQFDYTKSLDGGHHIFAMLMGNGWQRINSEVYHPTSSLNFGLQLSYNYQHRYYADFTGAYTVSAKLPEGNRGAVSPTGTLGWRITNEDFMQSQSIFDDLVFTVSGGIISQDLDIVMNDQEYYLYKQVLSQNANNGDIHWWTWAESGLERRTAYIRGENLKLGFIKRKEISFGLRGALLNRSIDFDVNYFQSTMDGGLAKVYSLFPNYFEPSSIRSIIPILNYNVDDRKGVDFRLNYNTGAGDLLMTFGICGMYQIDERVKRDENYEFDYQTRIGRPISQMWGLKHLGFFQDNDEIENSPVQRFATVKPGDLKYFDRNGDGEINANDEVYLGRGTPNTVLGANITLKWKNFTLFAMGRGYFGGYGLKNSSNYYWSGAAERKYAEIVRNHWTAETAATATYPRLTTGNGSNSFRNSDFWLYKTDRFDISLVQLTYDFSMSRFPIDAVKDLSIYLGGYNLATISKERKHLEMNIGSAPQTRFFNLGLKATF